MLHLLHIKSNSNLGTGVKIGQICRGYELEILGILLTVDLRVMDMSEFDVILNMDWVMEHRVVIDCDRKRVTAYTLGSDSCHSRAIGINKICVLGVLLP